jgi:hypothetical protein
MKKEKTPFEVTFTYKNGKMETYAHGAMTAKETTAAFSCNAVSWLELLKENLVGVSDKEIATELILHFAEVLSAETGLQFDEEEPNPQTLKKKQILPF